MEVEKQTDRRLKQQECDMHVKTLTTVTLSRLSVTGPSAVALSEPEDLQGKDSHSIETSRHRPLSALIHFQASIGSSCVTEKN